MENARYFSVFGHVGGALLILFFSLAAITSTSAEEIQSDKAFSDSLGPLQKQVRDKQRLLNETDDKKQPVEWARRSIDLAVALKELGTKQEGSSAFEEAADLLRSAVAIEELKFRENPAEILAEAQNQLGRVLLGLGQRKPFGGLLENALAWIIHRQAADMA